MLTMSRQPPARGEMDRKQFVGDADVLAALGVTVEELADPDVRSVVIRHEHPEFEDAVKEHLYEIDLGDGPMNPRLHLAMHEIVATQLWDNSPPALETAVRLRRRVRATRSPAHAQSTRSGPGLGGPAQRAAV